MSDSFWQSLLNTTGSVPDECGIGIRMPILFTHIRPESRRQVSLRLQLPSTLSADVLRPEDTTVNGLRINNTALAETDGCGLRTEAQIVYNHCISVRTGATIQSGSDQNGRLPGHHGSAASLMKSYLHITWTVNGPTG